jgi:hypothetical protein
MSAIQKAARILIAFVSSLVLIEGPMAFSQTQVRTYSTIQSIGIEIDMSNDPNRNASATVRYRKTGEATWKQAMPLIRVDYAKDNMLAGSILFLEPATAYEIKLNTIDPDIGSKSGTMTINTKPIPDIPKSGRTLHVVPGLIGGDGSAGNPFQGMEKAWAEAQPGDIFLLHSGDYGEVSDIQGRSGTSNARIVFKAFGDGEAILRSLHIANHSHLWFEGLTFKAKAVDGNEIGLYSCKPKEDRYDSGFTPMNNEIDDIVIVRNTFRDFKNSIVAGPKTRGWYIADNTIYGNKVKLGGSGTESFDGEGIELAHGGGHTVAYNSITHVADGVSYPGDNCDIYGNDIFDVTDDGLELDWGKVNTRAWGNRIHNAGHNGISFQPQGGAPWYILRNQVVNFQESVFKFRPMDDLSVGRFIAAHNTFVNQGRLLDQWGMYLFRGMTRNNLWISLSDRPIWSLGEKGIDPGITDLDYDGFDWGSGLRPFNYIGRCCSDLSSLYSATGQEKHGIRIDHEKCFETLNVPGPAPLTTIPPQYITLKANCKAVDAGAVLPNINDGYKGAAPDLGAYEVGANLPHYGPRGDNNHTQAASSTK